MTIHVFVRRFPFIWLLLALFAGSQSEAAETLYFKGKSFQDSRDGITVIRSEEAPFITISSSRFHYFLVLPYADEWNFVLDEKSMLRGTSGRVNVTLFGGQSAQTPVEALERHRSRLLANKSTKGVEKIELIHFGGEPLLRQTQDAEAATGSSEHRGAKIYQFFAARKWKDELFLLHLSTLVAPGEQDAQLEEKYSFMVAKGFRVDFMREGGEAGEGVQGNSR